jgi:hypothetical protein
MSKVIKGETIYSYVKIHNSKILAGSVVIISLKCQAIALASNWYVLRKLGVAW